MAGKAAPRPRILHVFANFDANPGPMRAVTIINALGKAADHAIVSADPARRGAGRHLAKTVKVAWPKFPPLAGKATPGRLLKLASAMAGYDLICTYGYGALDAAMAHTLFADVHRLAPLVHHELEVEWDEAAHKRRRGWYRRFALGRTAALVVSDKTIEAIALERWDQPRTRVRLIAGGMDTRAFSAPAKRDLLPGLIKRRDEMWIGTFITGDRVPDLFPLIRALPATAPEWQLVITGDAGDSRPAVEDEAERLGVEDRMHFVGSEAFDPAVRVRLFALFDICALPDGLVEAPGIALEAMAAGAPVVAPRFGEVPALLSSDNGPWLSEPGVDDDLAGKLQELAVSPADRKRVGQANRNKVREEFDESRMIERTRALYLGLMGLRREDLSQNEAQATAS